MVPFLFYRIFINVMKFKNILTEAIVDTLDISKLDRGILKTIHKFINEKGVFISRNGEKTEWDLSDGEKLLKVSQALGYNDYDHLFKLYKFYLKHRLYLFDESPKIDTETDVDELTDYKILRPILLQYMYDNYIGKEYNVNGIIWKVDTPLGDMSEALTEEATAMEFFTWGRDVPIVVGYLEFIKSTEKIMKGNGYDVISMDDDLSTYYGTYGKRNKFQHEEILNSGYVTNVKFPNNLKEESLKKYFDELINVFVSEVLPQPTEIILDYMDHVNAHQPPQ